MSEKIKCPHCDKEYSKHGIKNHIAITHDKSRPAPMQGKVSPSWNKGLTKDTDERILRGAESYKDGIKTGRISPAWKDKILSEEHKKSVSDGMKKAHAEGRAWNIGMSRWNNEPSYPEKFFMEVIENEFLDKNYQREFPISIWSFDFAWPHLKKAVEIDGEQHERFPEYKERDKRKDAYATENGWSVLRISWKDFYKDTKYWIQISKDFMQ